MSVKIPFSVREHRYNSRIVSQSRPRSSRGFRDNIEDQQQPPIPPARFVYLPASGLILFRPPANAPF
jgi:hypothetical protein